MKYFLIILLYNFINCYYISENDMFIYIGIKNKQNIIMHNKTRDIYLKHVRNNLEKEKESKCFEKREDTFEECEKVRSLFNKVFDNSIEYLLQNQLCFLKMKLEDELVEYYKLLIAQKEKNIDDLIFEKLKSYVDKIFVKYDEETRNYNGCNKLLQNFVQKNNFSNIQKYIDKKNTFFINDAYKFYILTRFKKFFIDFNRNSDETCIKQIKNIFEEIKTYDLKGKCFIFLDLDIIMFYLEILYKDLQKIKEFNFALIKDKMKQNFEEILHQYHSSLLLVIKNSIIEQNKKISLVLEYPNKGGFSFYMDFYKKKFALIEKDNQLMSNCLQEYVEKTFKFWLGIYNLYYNG